jgi:hypothetical protein
MIGPKDEKRAETELRRSAVRTKNSGGRPLKGKEPRVRVNCRLEPTMVAELEQMTGRKPVELLEAMHDVLVLVVASSHRGGAQRAVFAKIRSLLTVDKPKRGMR